MSLRFSSIIWVLIAAGFAHPVCGQQGRVYAAGESTNSLNPKLASKLDEIRASALPAEGTEDPMKQPFKIVNPANRLGMSAPIVAPPPPPQLNSKRAREMLDNQKNWVFMAPTDYSSEKTIDQMLGNPKYDQEEQEDSRATVVERFYIRQARAAAGNTNQARGGSAASDGINDGADSIFGNNAFTRNQPRDVKKSEAPSKPAMFGSMSPFADSPGSWGNDNIFGFANREAVRKRDEAAPAAGGALDDFKKMLQASGMTPATPGASPANNLGDFYTKPPGASDASAIVPNLLGAQPAALGTYGRPQGLSDTVFGPIAVGSMPPPAPVSPHAELLKLSKPPPGFSIPKRTF